MKKLSIGIVAAGLGFIYGKLHGDDHLWRRYGKAENHTPQMVQVHQF